MTQKMIPLADVIKLTEEIKRSLISNYPKGDRMFFGFGANSNAVAIIDGWVMDKGLTAEAMKVRTDHAPVIILGPVSIEQDKK